MPNSFGASFFKSGQQSPIDMSPVAYQSKFANTSPISSIISQIADKLKPQTPTSQTMQYDTFADPYRQVYNNFANTNLRPEFERFTLNPFLKNYATNAGVNNSFSMGNYANNLNNDRAGVEKNYYSDLEQGKNSIESLVRGQYDSFLKNAGNSPTFNMNI